MSNKAPRILIIEDEEELAAFVARFLQDLGYEISISNDGMEGLALARQLDPALIILDVNLPKLNGFTISRLLKFDDNFKHIPIIMWTWREADHDREMGLYAGADCYLPKPFSVLHLRQKIEVLIGPPPNPEGSVELEDLPDSIKT